MKYFLFFFIIFLFPKILFSNTNNIEKINPNTIYKNIRCLVCQGQSVYDSDSDFAQTLKEIVNDKIKDGFTEQEIYEFLIDKYGEWIVLKPSFNYKNFLLWSIPYIVFVIFGVYIFLFIKKSKLR
ncbi:MAG: cytochrome c-type biogenesis protein CcmH [Candidatus Pelagibacter sp.]|nr:cytochrome c-type biogenesis protein CcmH [Candidatus Pelagibacter sp.]|tara:strand:+ start:4131 stop:4505 length:375 start_codon:yes stop_codon:yes gene_type:complete